MQEIVTTEEKIDYIYKTLKSNQRKALIGGIFKWGFRLAILVYLYIFITKGVPAMIDTIIPSFQSIPGVNLEETLGGSNTEDIVKKLSESEYADNPAIKKILDSYLKQ